MIFESPTSSTNSHTARCRDGCLLPMALTYLGAEPETPELRQHVQQAMHRAQCDGDSVRVIPAPGSQRVPMLSSDTSLESQHSAGARNTKTHQKGLQLSLFRKILWLFRTFFEYQYYFFVWVSMYFLFLHQIKPFCCLIHWCKNM